jgi:hypothetical protein
METTTATTTIT